MRICFNVRHVGLANNGGSRTLIRCAETLRELGHDAFLYVGTNTYSWHKHNAKLIKTKEHPECDVTIATGYNSWPDVARYTKAKRCWYIRGFELWKAKEAKLLNAFKQIPNLFVNSQWLCDYLKSHNISSTVQYPGLDTDWFKPLGLARSGVGALMHNIHKTKRSCDALTLKTEYNIPIKLLNKDIKKPNPEQLNNWYNGLLVWFAPTELEGLHNPPIEAALAGCALVCTDHERSGMQDYAINGETALVYPARDLVKARECIELLLADEDLRVKLNKNLVDLITTKFGTRSTRMVEFCERLKNESSDG